MLKIENTEVLGWEHAIRGMRNPLNSWAKSDSYENYSVNYEKDETTGDVAEIRFPYYRVGAGDLNLMKRLRNAGTDHRKFMRMIAVYVDITAPLYWWKEFKTYRAGRKFGDDEPDVLPIPEDYLELDIEMNSCSTMHKITSKEFTLDDFSHEHLTCESITFGLEPVIGLLNKNRELYLQWTDAGEEKKSLWWQMIQLLPTSYNQKRTVMLNYEVLANIYKSRRNHKLNEWHTFCDWIEGLPYSELITGIDWKKANPILHAE